MAMKLSKISAAVDQAQTGESSRIQNLSQKEDQAKIGGESLVDEVV